MKKAQILQLGEHRNPNDILLQWAAISNKIGWQVTAEELQQFDGLISPELITFILLKQKEE